MILFQILFTLFSLYAIFNVWKKKKEGQLGSRGAGFWILFWLSAIVAVLWPNSTTILANKLGIGRGSDLVLYISIVIIFFLIFKLHLKIEAVSRDITKVVRKESLNSRNE